ncbi:MAG: hypothetical protein PVI23_02855 [Maricaulaceae bacterium]
MNRIEPIRRSHALVRRDRSPMREDQPAGWDGRDRRRRSRSRATDRPARTNLGEAAAAAAYEIHLMTSGFSAGLRADLAMRGVWATTYAASGAERPASPKLHKIT